MAFGAGGLMADHTKANLGQWTEFRLEVIQSSDHVHLSALPKLNMLYTALQAFKCQIYSGTNPRHPEQYLNVIKSKKVQFSEGEGDFWEFVPDADNSGYYIQNLNTSTYLGKKGKLEAKAQTSFVLQNASSDLDQQMASIRGALPEEQIENGCEKFVISANGKYLQIQKNGSISACSGNKGEWEKMLLKDISRV
jgi:hypothetical protein